MAEELDNDGGIDIDSAVEEIGADLFGKDDAGGESQGTEATPSPAPVPTPSSTDKTAPTTNVGTVNTTDTPTPTATPLSVPKTWRQEAAGLWGSLPPVVQAEIAKRENEIYSGIEQYKANAMFGKAFADVVNPFASAIQAAGVDIMELTKSLFSAHHTLTHGNAQQRLIWFAQLAKDYNVDVRALSGGSVGALASGQVNPTQDPQVQALLADLGEVKTNVDRLTQANYQRVRDATAAEVNAFADDPKNKHFDEVANLVVELIQRGMSTTLADAYEKACRLDPVVAGKIATEAATAAAEAARQEAAKHAKTARNASRASVRSSKVSPGTKVATGSIDDTLAATLATIKQRDN